MRFLTSASRRRIGLFAACCLNASAGLICGFLAIGWSLSHLSFDVLAAFRPAVDLSAVVVVTLQKPDNRSMTARLLDRFADDEARLVAIDVFFDGSEGSEEDLMLAAAMRRHGNVLIAGILDAVQEHPLVIGGMERRPASLFLTNAAGWGLATLVLDSDMAVRRLFEGTRFRESLPLLAAANVEPSLSRKSVGRVIDTSRWLNYYGPSQSFMTVRDQDVFLQRPGFFRGKVVFVGGRRPIGLQEDKKDMFRSPFSRWTGLPMAGVEIMATSYLNLARKDWLTRWPPWMEATFYVGSGLLTVLWLNWRRGRKERWFWMGAMGMMIFGLAWMSHGIWKSWFPWLVVVVVQIPLGLVMASLLVPSKTSVPSNSVPQTLPKPLPETATRDVSDHMLLRRIGRGACGEVWLARNAVGMYRAVKIVYRDWFDSPEPYEREFNGIKSFMPISMGHSGLVHVMHVGIQEKKGFFYYVMDAGDDMNAGQAIEPASYTPKDLQREIERRRTLPPAEVLSLIKSLAEALGYLHAHGMVHRDIKPANIIFVNGRPKLADIGLVRTVNDKREGRTIIGTQGYLLLDSPGTVAADLYAMGKVIYVALTGMKPELFPELPTDTATDPDGALYGRLQEIAWKACGLNPSSQYSTVLDLVEDLRGIES